MSRCRAPPPRRRTVKAGTDGSTVFDDPRPPRFTEEPARGTTARKARLIARARPAAHCQCPRSRLPPVVTDACHRGSTTAMDGLQFDTLVRTLAAGITRRGALGVLAGLVGLQVVDSVEAKRHQHHHRGKAASVASRRRRVTRSRASSASPTCGEVKRSVGVSGHCMARTATSVYTKSPGVLLSARSPGTW